MFPGGSTCKEGWGAYPILRGKTASAVWAILDNVEAIPIISCHGPRGKPKHVTMDAHWVPLHFALDACNKEDTKSLDLPSRQPFCPKENSFFSNPTSCRQLLTFCRGPLLKPLFGTVVGSQQISDVSLVGSTHALGTSEQQHAITFRKRKNKIGFLSTTLILQGICKRNLVKCNCFWMGSLLVSAIITIMLFFLSRKK